MSHPVEGGCGCPCCGALNPERDPSVWTPTDTDAAYGGGPTAAPAEGNSETVYSSESGKPIYDNAGIINALTTFDGASASGAWAGSTVTYSISSGGLSPGEAGYRSEYAGYVQMSARMQEVAREAFELWDELIAIDLVESEDDPTANVLFNYSSQTSGNGTYASTSYSFAFTERADWAHSKSQLWFSNGWWTHDQDTDLYQGGYGVLTYLHEIGHALGLSHPGNYNGSGNYATDASYHQDTRAYTVQSYFNASVNGSGADHFAYTGSLRYGATPLLHDIMTVQAIYGADMTTRTEATTYGFNSTANRDAFDFTLNTAPVVAIWDAGGIDTIDVSGFSENQTLTLVEGEFSNIGRQTQNLAIAYGAVIENAVGGSGNDLIFGNIHNNSLQGGLGSDTLYGGDGNDTIDGGDGNDTIDGGDGFDVVVLTSANAGLEVDFEAGTISGGTGDTISNVEGVEGSAFADVMRAGSAASYQAGYGGADSLFGGSADDSLYGGDGADWLSGGDGADTIQGGAGFDTVDYSTSAGGIRAQLWGVGQFNAAEGDTLTEIEQIVGSAYRDTLIAAGNDTTVDGGDGDDDLYDGTGAAHLLGGAGNDQFIGGAGGDFFYGGTGIDTARYASAAGAVIVSLTSGSATGSDAAGDQFDSIENLVGSHYDDGLTGDAQANRLEGLGGVDTLDGGAGDDVILGGDGGDSLFGSDGADSLSGGSGDDRLLGGSGDDDLVGGTGADTLDGGEGRDSVDYSASTAGVNVGLFRAGTGGHSQGDQLSTVEHIIGSTYQDTLVGGGTGDVTLDGGIAADLLFDYNANATLYGGQGFDILVGGGGNDTLFGGEGEDQLFGGSGADSIDGGDGLDWLNYSTATGSVAVDLAAGIGTLGEAAGDTLSNVEKLLGGNFNDTLRGDDGFNWVLGGGGDDIVSGGGDTDYLWGDGGADIFLYDSPDWGRDVVFDFEDGVDLIDLRGSGLTFGSFDVIDTPQGTRLDWFDGATTHAIHLFGVNPADISAADFLT